jgi:hypothetical protein
MLREVVERRRITVEQGAELVVGRALTSEECDGLWAVLSVEVYQLLTDLRGWTPHQYETWLADVLDRLLPMSAQPELSPAACCLRPLNRCGDPDCPTGQLRNGSDAFTRRTPGKLPAAGPLARRSL